jgi:ABC-2 type transport system permease protein
MELVLGVPRSRSQVVLERLGAVVVAAIAMPIFIWLSIWVGAQMVNMSLDMGVVATAALSILPMELIVIALVYVLSERLRLGAIVSIVATFIVVSYAINLLGEVLNLPAWVLSLSMFHVYGTPLLSGWQVGSFVGMLVVALALFAVGVAQFARADVQRGT